MRELVTGAVSATVPVTIPRHPMGTNRPGKGPTQMAPRKPAATATEPTEVEPAIAGMAKLTEAFEVTPETETPAAPEAVFIPHIGDEFGRLLRDAQRVVKGWRPIDGVTEEIAGRVVSTEWLTFDFTDEQTGEQKTNAAPATILSTGGPNTPLVRVVWLGLVLETAWQRHNPQRDDVVALKRLGMVKSQTGMEYRDWNVLVEKAPGNLTGAQLKKAASMAAAKPAASGPDDDPFDDF